MPKLKSIVFVVGMLLLSAVMGYLSIKYLSAITPANSYKDKGAAGRPPSVTVSW